MNAFEDVFSSDFLSGSTSSDFASLPRIQFEEAVIAVKVPCVILTLS